MAKETVGLEGLPRLLLCFGFWGGAFALAFQVKAKFPACTRASHEVLVPCSPRAFAAATSPGVCTLPPAVRMVAGRGWGSGQALQHQTPHWPECTFPFPSPGPALSLGAGLSLSTGQGRPLLLPVVLKGANPNESLWSLLLANSGTKEGKEKKNNP